MKNGKNNQQILIGGSVMFRDNRGRRQWLVVKQNDDLGWEIPKITVRRGESSVRSVIRMISEQGGLTARVLEEAGRLNGTAIVNSKPIPQKFYYYLMIQKGGQSEMIGFNEYKWLEFADASKKIVSKKEKEILKSARDILKEWEKTHNVKKQFLEEEPVVTVEE